MIVKEAGIRSCRNRSCDTRYHKEYYDVIVQLLSCVRLFVTPWTATRQVLLYSTTSWSLLKYMSIELVMVSNHLIFCCPLLLLITLFPRITVFSNGSSHQMGKILEPISISLSNEYSGLLSFRFEWLDLLAVQGTL